MPKIIAIDPGRNCGVAYFDGDLLTASQLSLGTKSDSWVEMTGRMWARLHRLSDEHGQPDLIVIESSFFNSKNPTAILLQRFVGVVMLFASVNKCPCVEVAPQTWKASIGNGKMTPDQYRKAAPLAWGEKELPKSQEDMAAALGILWWAWQRRRELIKQEGEKS